MKALTAFFLCSCLIFSLAVCGKSGEALREESQTAQIPQTESTEETAEAADTEHPETAQNAEEPSALSSVYHMVCPFDRFACKSYGIMTLFWKGNGRMAIHTMMAKQSWYHELNG